MNATVHIFAATTLDGCREVSPILERLYYAKATVLILQKGEEALETPRSNEKSPLLRHTGLNPVRSRP